MHSTASSIGLNEALTLSIDSHHPADNITFKQSLSDVSDDDIATVGAAAAAGSAFLNHHLILTAVISVAVIVVVVVIFVIYTCADRKYRLNWFQKNVLLAEHEQQERNQCRRQGGVNSFSVATDGITGGGSSTNSGTRHQDESPRSGQEADQTTRLLSPKAAEIGYAASGGRWRSLLPGGTRRNTTAVTVVSPGLFSPDHVQTSQQQRHWYDTRSGEGRKLTTVTVNYVSLRRCDRQPSSFDSMPSSPTSAAAPDDGLTGNSSSDAVIGSATADAKQTSVKSNDAGNIGNLPIIRSSLLERR